MGMRRIRFRIVLPVIFGVLALFLFAWDYENGRVVASVGMGWDTGPPVWPYQAVPSFSYALNAPAYIISWPILKLLNLRTLSLQYAVWFPAIVMLWWWVGRYFDFGFPGCESHSRLKLRAAMLLVSSSVLAILAARVCFDQYRWTHQYWSGHPLTYATIFLGPAGSILWCLFFATIFFRAAIHRVGHRLAASTLNRTTYRLYLFFALVLSLNAVGVSHLDHLIRPAPDPTHCETDRLHRLGCVHGTATDENQEPVAHVEINLIPRFKFGDARRFGTKNEWTDEQGRFNFDSTEKGEYTLAVNPFDMSAGPMEEEPFDTRYYPDAEGEVGAEPVTVNYSSATNLYPLKLRKSKFMTIEVSVEWEDGSRPKRSDIFVQNTRYWGLLGGFEEIEYGVGKISLAQGFEYVANAQVECVGRNGPEHRLAKPSPMFKVAAGQTPTNLSLVLLGAPCVLWERP
jgi:hypothetical protein